MWLLSKGRDSNPRRLAPIDLQSIPIGHSGTLGMMHIIPNSIWQYLATSGNIWQHLVICRMNIPPSYTITPELLSKLSKIDVARTSIATIPLPPELTLNIQRKILLKSSLFSARIEGNSLTERELISTSKDREKQEVFNIVQAAQWVHKGAIRTLKPAHLLELHMRILKNLASDAGAFRTEMGAIFNAAGIAVYVSPAPEKIHALLKELFTFINEKNVEFPLITALISHLIFEKIHPFVDGNGRVGRLLIPLILKSLRYDFGGTIPIEEYLENHKEEYYYQLDRGMTHTNEYLDFMLDAFYEGIQILQAQINQSHHKKLLLPPRQEELYQLIKDHHMLSFDMIKRRFLQVPPRTLRYDLKKLQDAKLITKVGKTRGSYYSIPLAI